MTNSLLSLWDIDNNVTPDAVTDSQFYRAALQQGQAYLKEQFAQQKDVVTLIQQRAYFVDQVLNTLWQHHINPDIAISLLAVGGYGRGELHPYSDIDLLVLLDESISDHPPEALSAFLTQ